jgi:hypothetical protein
MESSPPKTSGIAPVARIFWIAAVADLWFSSGSDYAGQVAAITTRAPVVPKSVRPSQNPMQLGRRILT